MSRHTVAACPSMQNRIGSIPPDSQIRSPPVSIILNIDHSPGHCLATVFPEFIARDDTERAAPGPSRNPLRHRLIPTLDHTIPKHLDDTGRQATIAGQAMGTGKTQGAAKKGPKPLSYNSPRSAKETVWSPPTTM